MDSAVVAVAPAPAPAVAPASVVPESQALLAAASSGQMSLQVLMDRAQVLQSGAQPETAALLYETWLAAALPSMRGICILEEPDGICRCRRGACPGPCR